MKILPVSDLHLDYENPHVVVTDLFKNIKNKEEIVLIVAGDTFNGVQWKKTAEFKKAVQGFRKVIVVFGNHDLWYGRFGSPDDLNDLREAFETQSNIVTLDKNIYQLDDVTFYGCILYTRIDPRVTLEVLRTVSDFEYIKTSSGHKISPSYTDKINEDYIQWLYNIIANRQFRKRKAVVITHFPPTIDVQHQKYKWDHLYSYFYNRDAYLDHILNDPDLGPDLWISGHTHGSFDISYAKTRLVLNPRGYSQEANPEFNPELIIEI